MASLQEQFAKLQKEFERRVQQDRQSTKTSASYDSPGLRRGRHRRLAARPKTCHSTMKKVSITCRQWWGMPA
jgi:hypothetical protein